MGDWIEIELDEEPTRHRRPPLGGSPAGLPRPPSRLDRRQRRALAVGAGAVVLGVGWAVARSGDDLGSRSAPSSTAARATDATSPQSTLADVEPTQPDTPTTRPRPTTTTGPPVVVLEGAGPMLPTATGIELVALTADGNLLDVDLDTGAMTTTDIPGGASSAPGLVIAQTDWAYVQRWDVSTSFLVPRGQPPAEISPTGDLGSGVYVGPDPGTLWRHEHDPSSGQLERLVLIDLRGEPLGRSIEASGWWPAQSDLHGGLLVQRGGAVYSVTETGGRLIAPGDLVGVGVGHVLVRECDESMVCTLVVVDRTTLERRPVPGADVGAWSMNPGEGTSIPTVSPDGTAAVVIGPDGDFVPTLVDLGTGEHVELSPIPSPLSVGWSDDARYVVFTRNTALWAYDRQTGGMTELEHVPPVVNFAPRP